MTSTLPRRKWADDEEDIEATPIVVISSRDGAEVPHVTAAANLAELAKAHGWTVGQTYALASMPEETYRNGRRKQAAHMLHTVCVRLMRRAPGLECGFAIWCRVDDGGWRFRTAWIQGEQHGARSAAQRVTS